MKIFAVGQRGKQMQILKEKIVRYETDGTIVKGYDAGELIRCKDCRFMSNEIDQRDGSDVFVCNFNRWRRMEGKRRDDFYCADGERKEEFDCNDCYYSMQNCKDKTICCEDETTLCDNFEPVVERKANEID